MPIYFHTDDISFLLRNKLLLKNWIKKVAGSYEFNIGSLNYIFTSERQMLKINSDFLNHDYFTDIITFDYSEKKVISGDIYISIERVKENAITFGEGFNDELKRVMIHGILHLIGFKDKTKPELAKMRDAEGRALSLVDDLIIV